MRKKLIVMLFFIQISTNFADLITFYTGLPAGDARFKTVEARLTEAFKRLDYEFELINLPKLRALETANSMGDGDAHRVYSISELQPALTNNLIRIDTPIRGGNATRIYALNKNQVEVKNYDDLKQFKANGYLRGISYFEKNIPNAVPINSAEQLIKLLNLDRLDTIAMTEEELLSVDYRLRVHVVQIGRVERTRRVYPYIHKKYADLAPLLKETLEEMKKDGTYDKLNFE